MRRDAIETTLAALATMSPAQLREEWTLTTDKPLPRLSSAMLRLALGYELQCRACGGLTRQTRQRLDQLAAARTETRSTVPGMRLVREHNGQVHIVTIGEDGAVEWNGRTWRSLSEVARTITGTHWSGPAFFGLKQKKRKAA
ncbi:DUF2924 domain-containing protein [Novosphingobium sp. Gsoil 351]|uniref:DUF2924 domain-containing protein n=1 Tax=Novosphingobium sp. Gsoil 351 TaxID=2675225 RepID=UPI0012B475AC|nr:DUF2924 domain-containing protein [Novosphingobium sp. Gsoil 351]QGN54239.1 DUF2924 domain-containing protein [Novosphingobium sp. Gsoil 351]